MNLVNLDNVLLQEDEIVLKKGEVLPNLNFVGEATVVLSEQADLKKGDRVIINRNGIFPIVIKKKPYILLNIEDILLKL